MLAGPLFWLVVFACAPSRLWYLRVFAATLLTLHYVALAQGLQSIFFTPNARDGPASFGPPPMPLAGAAWFTRRAVVTAIRKFKDGQNNYLWQPSFIAGQPETIMGYPVARMDDMPALATDSLSLAFGNMAAAYQIVDRMGVRVIRDNLTSKPYVKFYTAKRTGGAVVNFEALKFLKFGT